MGPTILIVDDHDGFRTQARVLLEVAGYVVVGEADTATSGVAAAESLRPDVVLLDVQLPDANGFDLVGRLSPISKVVMISGQNRSSFRSRLADSAAVGFIPKEHLSSASLAAILEPTEEDR